MSKPLLSILIPLTPDRIDVCGLLVKKIGFANVDLNKAHSFHGDLFIRQEVITEEGLPIIELFVYCDPKTLTIGEKRERLYKMTKSLYSWQIDSDDDISDNAIQLILEAIKTNPEVDCVTFEERVRLDGVEYKSNHSLNYTGWFGDGSKELSDGFHFWRTPFFKSVIKTEIAKSVPIPHCRWGEDNMWADELHKVLKTEYHINQQLYYYDYISSPHNERYGIK